MLLRTVLTISAALALAAGSVLAADWPRWMGPDYNGSSPETGLATTFPAGGPKLLWKVAGGDGISSLAIVGKRVFTMVQRGGKELAVCLDADTGKQVWETALAPGFDDQQGNGPRATPAVDGKSVYVQCAGGVLACLNADDGKIVWQHNLLTTFNAENIAWGLSASPLVDGDRVYAVPGAKGAGAVAYEKTTGKLLWKSGNDVAAYASPAAVTVGSTRQALFFNASGLIGVAAESGKELWRIPWKTGYDCNITTPLVIGDNVFIASGEKVGCAMFKLGAGAPTQVWAGKGPQSVLMTYWATAVERGGRLYGLSGEFSGVINLNCVDAKTGKLVWSQPRFGAAGLVLADGHLYLTTRTGELVVVAAEPGGFKETARAKVAAANSYICPAISDKRLYFRDRQNVYCVDLSK